VSQTDNDIIKHLSSVDEQERKLGIERALTFEKAMKSGDVDTIYKATQYYNQFTARQAGNKSDGMKSMVFDPFDSSASMGYYNRSSRLSYSSLRAMSRAPIIRAIINTRKDQVAEFCKVQVDKYSKGYLITKKGIDDSDDLSSKDKREIDNLQQFILNCGQNDVNNRWEWKYDAFETFVRKLIEDSLVLDQACFEIIPQRNFEPYAFVAVDSATFRIADSINDKNNIKDTAKVLGCYPSYVQLYQGNIWNEFYPWELCFGIRNPSTNINVNGYGCSELEDLITTVTAMLNADSYNGKFFRNGSSPKGALLVKKGNLNPDKVNQLRRDWNNMVAGVENAHKTLILDAESTEWVPMHINNKDMEFSNFQIYLIKLACAVYKISPEEIGFPLEGQGGSGLGNDSGKDEKDYSMNKGLKPLLTFIESLINKYIIGPKTNDAYEFKFVGLDIESAAQEEERLSKAVTTYMEVNEVRKARGLKPKPGYDIILNPIISQMRQMDQQFNNDAQQGLQEQEDEDKKNTNPFLMDNEEDNPFAKSFNNFVKKELLVA
jgi:hypothetical protein